MIESGSDRFDGLDRLFWLGLSQFWQHSPDALVFVQPYTMVRRNNFDKIGHDSPVQGPFGADIPPSPGEIRHLILQTAAANPLGRGPRIHGGLKCRGSGSRSAPFRACAHLPTPTIPKLEDGSFR
jgi:hypothetical protein